MSNDNNDNNKNKNLVFTLTASGERCCSRDFKLIAGRALTWAKEYEPAHVPNLKQVLRRFVEVDLLVSELVLNAYNLGGTCLIIRAFPSLD